MMDAYLLLTGFCLLFLIGAFLGSGVLYVVAFGLLIAGMVRYVKGQRNQREGDSAHVSDPGRVISRNGSHP